MCVCVDVRYPTNFYVTLIWYTLHAKLPFSTMYVGIKNQERTSLPLGSPQDQLRSI